MNEARIPWGLVLIAFLTLFTVVMVDSSPVKHRSKRTIIQMCGLVQYYTKRSCLEYNNYGCFCGLGNKGRKPLDTIDACCLRHDNCYGLVECWWFYPQWVGYSVVCNKTGCTCMDSLVDSPCARTTCDCDLGFASCLSEGRYHSYYSNYNRALCSQQPWQVGEMDEQEQEEETTTAFQENDNNGNTEVQQNDNNGNTEVQQNDNGNTELQQNDNNGNTEVQQNDNNGNTEVQQNDNNGNTEVQQYDNNSNREVQRTEDNSNEGVQSTEDAYTEIQEARGITSEGDSSMVEVSGEVATVSEENEGTPRSDVQEERENVENEIESTVDPEVQNQTNTPVIENYSNATL